jgi:hypothetical protein
VSQGQVSLSWHTLVLRTHKRWIFNNLYRYRTSVDLEDLPKFGIDPSLDKFRLIRSNKVEDVNMVLTQLVDELKTQKLAGYEIPK